MQTLTEQDRTFRLAIRHALEMETLGGFALHSAPATHPATPSLRSASPNHPTMVRRRQSRRAPHATFMQFVNASVAKEAGRLHLWRERFWSRRYRSIVVADEKAAHARIRYILAHGAKEGLLASSAAWPGPNCIAALTTGALLRGTWFDRSKEFIARQRGEQTLPMQFATTFDVKLTPLPCLLHIIEHERQTHYRRVVGEIQAEAEADNKEKGRTPMTPGSMQTLDRPVRS
jgi:hypothetical protein